MKLIALSLALQSLVVAVPFRAAQRPILLDQLKAGKVDPSAIQRECFETFDQTTQKNDTVCINQVAPPTGNTAWGQSTQYCGYVDFDAGLSHLYFWLVMSESEPAKDPLVLWLNGGPGASSLLGLFDQWGPLRVLREPDAHGFPKTRSYSDRTNSKLNWVFLDQPVGAGFSYTTAAPRRTSIQAAQDVTTFLNAFMQMGFQNGQSAFNFYDRKLYIAGESYAGHYISAIGANLVDAPQAGINLQSLIIGNGIIDDVLIALGIYASFCGPSSTLNGDRAIVAPRCAQMNNWMANCRIAILNCRRDNNLCSVVNGACRDATGSGWAEALDRDFYDFTKTRAQGDERKNHYANGGELPSFINNANNNQEISAQHGRLWVYARENTGPGADTLMQRFVASGDWSRNYQYELQRVVSNGIDVLLYAGDQDLAVPALTVKFAASALDWDDWIDGRRVATRVQRDLFRNCTQRDESKLKTLSTGLTKYGSYIRVGKLAYARIYGAGHMINENRPSEAKNMFEKWILRNDEFENCS